MLKTSMINAGTVLKRSSLLLIAFSLLFLLPANIFAAGSVTMGWDANDTNPEGYRLFQREEGQHYDYNQWVYQGEEVTCTVNNLTGGVTYYFVVRAFSANVQSGDSNEIRYDAPLPQTHTISASAGTGGTISPSGSVSVEEGKSKSFTISPNSGYQISDVLVDGASKGAKTSHTFSNITGNHSIEARFASASSDQTPVAEAGSPQEVPSSAHVTLDGSGCSNPDGGNLSYQWTQKAGPVVNLSNSRLVKPEFTAPNAPEGSIQLRFELTVTNEKKLSASDTCIVQVVAAQNEPTDTDGDGTPDEIDDDDDGDGMPDVWEIQNGFNSLDSSDALLDADADGVTNLKECQQGTDPLVANENHPPDQPTFIYPKNGDARVDLAPRLATSKFKDPDENDSHLKTQWRIQTANAQQVVFQIISQDRRLRRLKIPRFILDPGTSYTAQVRYYDNHDLASEWSQPVTFTTQADERDQNGDGIPDDQEVYEATDLNKDNIPDGDQKNDLKRFKNYYFKRIMGLSIGFSDRATHIEAAADIDPFDLADETMATQLFSQEMMPYGMMGYKIKVAEPGQSARVQIYLSEPIDPETHWVRYDSATEWEDCSDHVQMDATGTIAERDLVDGGIGDADGVANGVIVDVVGPQVASDGNSLSLSDGGSAPSTQSSSCFIQSLF